MSGHQFALCRIFVGLFSILFFALLFPQSEALFTVAGGFVAGDSLPSWRIPNLFWLSDALWMVQCALVGGVLLGVGLMLGIQRRILELLLVALWSSLWARNPLAFHPGMGLFGLILFLMAVAPPGEPWSFREKPKSNWAIPSYVQWATLLCLSGLLFPPGISAWSFLKVHGGEALAHLLQLPGARDGWGRALILRCPTEILSVFGWGLCGVAVLAFPLALVPPARRWVWGALWFVNAFVWLIVGQTDLLFTIALVLLFCFQRSWVPPMKSHSFQPIVYFDGLCVLCNGAIDFVMAEDAARTLRFASIQGETAKNIQSPEVEQGQTMALQIGDRLYLHSDAVLQVALRLGGLWRVLGTVAWWVPKKWRDACYDQIQKNRSAIFGQRQSCRVPGPREQERFLP